MRKPVERLVERAEALAAEGGPAAAAFALIAMYADADGPPPPQEPPCRDGDPE